MAEQWAAPKWMRADIEARVAYGALPWQSRSD
jgi:hypothetical protein